MQINSRSNEGSQTTHGVVKHPENLPMYAFVCPANSTLLIKAFDRDGDWQVLTSEGKEFWCSIWTQDRAASLLNAFNRACGYSGCGSVTMQDIHLSAEGERDLKAHQLLKEKLAGCQSSRSLEEQYPQKGSMPLIVVKRLYQLREQELCHLAKKETIVLKDLEELDRIGRTTVASLMFQKCDTTAKSALLKDPHHFVRSAATIAQSEVDMIA